ncbi:MAG: hypothetical protein HY843_06580 [Bdellovibrio sp.]|nr:hypothetical protein [Bdellovibrio sp.]
MTNYITISCFLGLLLLSCGKGSRSTLNDPIPSGTIVAMGQFEGLNSKTVTGAASIYKVNTEGSFIVRLEGIASPSENGLQVVVKTSDTTVLKTPLRSTNGSQNYSFTVTDIVTWSYVSIFSTLSNLNYGMAILKKSD